jgi:translation initiation factor 1
MSDPNSRLVFSTATGRLCPDCGAPNVSCTCHSAPDASAPLPKRLTARLRVEKAGRGNKMVTMVSGLPGNAAFLKELCQTLKKVCGTGGTVLDDGLQLQGDVRDRVRAALEARGFVVKG